jgi:hypothetical protein
MTLTKAEKISQSLKRHFELHGTRKGVAGKPHTEETKVKLAEATSAYFDRKGRRTQAQINAQNKANVYAYRARLYKAVPPDADLKLIRKIYEGCPVGYHVDHVIALAAGGLHHQDNLQYLPVSVNCKKGKDRPYDASKAIRWQDSIPR